MSELAAHLVEHVLPRVAIRQWVFTVPGRPHSDGLVSARDAVAGRPARRV